MAVNLDELKEIMDGDIDLIKECFAEFLKDWPGFYVEIKTAILQKDGYQLNEAAHKLKGTLRYLAAEQAAQAAYELEIAGNNNNFTDAENQLQILKDECQKVVGYIKDFPE